MSEIVHSLVAVFTPVVYHLNEFFFLSRSVYTVIHLTIF